jgi:hypothetical protein
MIGFLFQISFSINSNLGDSDIPLLDTPDRPYSLYEGLSGMGCLFVDLLSRSLILSSRQKKETGVDENVVMEGIGFPCFEDL